MKVFLILLLGLAIAQKCGSSSPDQEEVTAVVYKAESRGFYLKISVDQQSITRWESRDDQTGTTYMITPDLWHTVISEIGEIALDEMAALETNQSGQVLDRAAIAELTVHTKDKSHTTPSFDHGSPPEAIAGVVKLLLEFPKTVERQ